jgi:hypothetical protein
MKPTTSEGFIFYKVGETRFQPRPANIILLFVNIFTMPHPSNIYYFYFILNSF